MNVRTAEPAKVPVLLLKTKSVPTDHYEELFSREGSNYTPSFLPVLEHRFKVKVIQWLEAVIKNRGSVSIPSHDRTDDPQFGGLIFTSQRAVEAFSSIVQSIGSEHIQDLLPAYVPLYVVGPATARGLRSLGLPNPVIGEESGNGQTLAAFMLEHYNALPSSQISPCGKKLPLLFLVGEVRRDIIPRTLQSPDLDDDQRIGVVERVVYETGEMESFHIDFSRALTDNEKAGTKLQWVVVFSPQGCKAMLQCLGWLDLSTGRYDPRLETQGALVTRIATIGPTTRDYLINELGFEPHASAEKPSAEGILATLETYQKHIGM
ncbi:hypothetical protein AAFC00_001091 [Neodothiora populina]|uniref:Tetrapyrrole biosynthesis uroporphyrinogen III synthase domain-containing protein n=1 Tax=Neodothiora populina TaxID=2781224 RepID=A0ABR3PMT2_9PEZI